MQSHSVSVMFSKDADPRELCSVMVASNGMSRVERTMYPSMLIVPMMPAANVAYIA
jgi:hypothetical protein